MRQSVFLAKVLTFVLSLVMVVGSASVSVAEQSIRGVIMSGGITCPMILDRSGRKIALLGLPSTLNVPGTHVRLTGQFIENSMCMQGEATFQIVRARALKRR